MTDMRDHWRQWVSRHSYDLAVTVNANTILSPHRQDQVMRAIDARLNTALLGRRYSRLPEGDRIGVVGVPEQKATAVHFHFAIRLPACLRKASHAKRIEAVLYALLRGQRDGHQFLPRASIHVTDCDAGWLDYVFKRVIATTAVYIRGLPTSSGKNRTTDTTEGVE